MKRLITLNAGGSSVKFGMFELSDGLPRLVGGKVEAIGTPDARLRMAEEGQGDQITSLGPIDHAAAIARIEAALAPYAEGHVIAAIGHRIVHGGPDIDGPRVLTAPLIEELASYTRLAPLHQPNNLAAVAAAEETFPEALQVGVFDTAFHRGHPKVNDIFAIPRRYYDKGLHRYGFHGLSYDFIARELGRSHPDLLAGKVLVAHLGNGASICGMEGGRSITCTMGFSPLEGLPMATRSGQLDPGVLLYLMEEEGMSAHDMSQMLYRESGLIGLSGGLSGDMQTLLASDAPEAAEALDYYCTRLAREIGAVSSVLGGIDALVFTAGIGENAPEIRAKALSKLGFLGLELEDDANAQNAPLVSKGRVPVLVIPTNEERVIAEATAAFLH